MTQSQLVIGLITLVILVAWIAIRIVQARRLARPTSGASAGRSEAHADQTIESSVGKLAEPLAAGVSDAADADRFEALEVKLEQAFAAVEEGRLSIAGYRTQMQAERQAMVRHRAALQTASIKGESDPAAMTTADEAITAIDWCLKWADGMENQTPQA